MQRLEPPVFVEGVREELDSMVVRQSIWSPD